jgi:hypothetical protein
MGFAYWDLQIAGVQRQIRPPTTDAILIRDPGLVFRPTKYCKPSGALPTFILRPQAGCAQIPRLRLFWSDN